MKRKITVFTESGPQLVEVKGEVESIPIEGRPNFTQMELGVAFFFGLLIGGAFGFGFCYLLFFL